MYMYGNTMCVISYMYMYLNPIHPIAPIRIPTNLWDFIQRF